jgi:glycolate oxidase
LNTTLSPKLYFPVKPSSHEVATIGGMISANSAGLRAIKYGKTCDWIAKLYVVDGLGKIAEASGSKIQDFCGKEGTTGVIVSAELKLSEPPQKISLDKLEFENLKDLIEKVKKFSGRKDVSALEFIDRKTSEFTGFANGKHVLLVEYEGDSGEIKNREEIEKIWVMRDGVYPALASRGYAVIEDPKIPADRMEEFLTWLEACEIPSFGHIGIGIIHPCYPINSEKTKELFEKVRSLKGDVSGEHGIGIAKKNYAGIDVVSRVMYLKKKYDPKKILNKGVLC